jgi:hypothetical protein
MNEAHFAREKFKNFHNKHMWMDENPHAILPSHHQQRFSIYILAGICGGNLFRPNTLPNMLTWQNYKAFLENNMPDFLADMPLIIHQNWTPCMMALLHISVSLPSGTWSVDGWRWTSCLAFTLIQFKSTGFLFFGVI